MKLILLILGVVLVAGLNAQITLKKKDETCLDRKDGEIEVMFDGILNNATYAWSRDGKPFTGGKKLTGLAPGDYAVTVSIPGGCMASKAIKIRPGRNMKVDISAHLLNVSPMPVRCGSYPEFTYRLTAVPSSGTPPYYCSWGKRDPGNGDCTIEVSGTSIAVDVFMSDSLGCADEDGWQKKSVKKICAKDPNDISGPDGYDTVRWVSVHDEMDYNVRFENDPIFATANAAVVFLSVPIDDDIDPFSFRLGSMGFGNLIINVPVNATVYQQRLDYSADLGFMLDVTAGLDVPNNRFFWLLETIDPLTGQPPADPTAGFLPVNDTLTGSGEGFVNFTCFPKLTTITGEIVSHQASIIFDANEALLTNTWTNMIDAFPPMTIAPTLPDTFYTNQIPFAWMMNDDPGGCGVSHGEVLLSLDNVVFQSQGFLLDSSQTTLTLQWDKTYYYKIRGTDFVGNQENVISDSFYIIPQKAIGFLTPDQNVYCIGDTLLVDMLLTSLPEVDLYISLDSGLTYNPLASNVASWPYPLTLDSTLIYPYIRIKAINVDNNIEKESSAFSVRLNPTVYAEGDPDSGCPEGILFTQAFGAFIYTWWPDTIMGSPTARFSNVYADQSQFAWVRGTDIYGCSSIDSVWLTVYPTSVDTVSLALCEGDSLLINGEWIKAEGYYPATYANMHSCDSVIVTEVFFESPCIWTGGPYVYVHKTASGANNGTSWEDAFTDLIDAIYVAGRYENVQEIWVAEGVYSPHPTNRDSSFILRDSIKIFGGFLGFETTRAERTPDPELVYLSGDINIQDTLWDNSYHTVSFNASCTDCILDGLTIRYGYADQIGNNTGAGLLNVGKGHLYNVVFERNYATELGAAVYSSGLLANLTFQSCTFRLNASSLGRDVVNLNGGKLTFDGVNSLH